MEIWPYPFWFAHRGAGKLAPENTLAAFRRGAQQGFKGFECDVKLSSDDVPYLLHDDGLDRTTSVHGPARAWRWEDLSRLDAGGWHSPPFAGEPPAHLASVAAFCTANNCALNLELKPCPGSERHTGRVVAQWLNRGWGSDQPPPLLSSFQMEALQGAKEAGPHWPRALLFETVPQDWASQMSALEGAALVANHAALTANLITEAHQHSWRVLAYTVNDETVAARLKSWGIDGLITDAIDRFSVTDFTH